MFIWVSCCCHLGIILWSSGHHSMFMLLIIYRHLNLIPWSSDCRSLVSVYNCMVIWVCFYAYYLGTILWSSGYHYVDIWVSPHGLLGSNIRSCGYHDVVIRVAWYGVMGIILGHLGINLASSEGNSFVHGGVVFGVHLCLADERRVKKWRQTAPRVP